MSVFAQLLMRAKDALRRKHRQPMTMHFDWDFDGPLDASWKVWCDLGPW